MSQANVDLVQRFLDADPEDIPAVLPLLDPDVEWIPLRAATEGAYLGHDGFERFMADTVQTFERFDPRFELEDLGTQVLAWGAISVQGRGSGVEMEVPVGGLFDCRDGRIVRWQDFGSRDAALEAAAGKG